MGTAGERRVLGSTGIEVSAITVGTSPLASMPNLYGYDVDERRAVDTVHAVFDSPITALDTSNGYGNGDSERRLGRAIAERGGLPPGFLLATKVDPDPVTGDFSGERVRRSVEESMERLGVDHLQLLYLHDPERMPFADAVAASGAVPAMIALRDEGVVDHLGVAGGPVAELRDYLGTGAFEVLLSHNRCTLLDRAAVDLFAEAAAAGIGVVNAAPYGGGMLSRGPGAQPRYAYGQQPDPRIAEAARAMAVACERRGVPLAAAALQFSLRRPEVTTTVVGISTPGRVAQTVELAQAPIPDELWAELERLAPPPDSWLA